jgi:GGDEF domain-containing protein
MSPELREKFKNTITAMLPGYLAVFNFADTKRRNSHLGHTKVDEDIEEFTELLRQAVGTTGYSLRIAGDEWLGFFAISSVEPIHQLLNDFYSEQKILTGWKSVGCKDNVQKSEQVTTEAKIARAMLCVYSYLERLEDFETTCEQLLKNDYGLPVSIPHNLQQITNSLRNRWQCVSQYPLGLPVCPFCRGDSFNWLDGDSSIYYGYGFCNNCGAEVEFSDI